MPMMMCATDRVIETNQGYVFRFAKNVPVHVPNLLVSFVMERGAFPADGEEEVVAKATETELTDKQMEPTDYEARQAAIIELVRKLTAENKLLFTAGGKPSPAQLSKELGWRVDAVERDAALDAMKKAAA